MPASPGQNKMASSETQIDALEGMHGHDHGPQDGPWWKTSKARLTIGCGIALAAAFVLAQVFPQTQPWGFIIAMAVGLIPIARRALSGAMNGSPFTIETLMAVAAVGAVIINAAEEAAVVVFLSWSANCSKASQPGGRVPASARWRR